MDNLIFNKVIVKTSSNNLSVIDLSNDTVTTNNLYTGVTAHDRTGEQIVGEADPIVDPSEVAKQHQLLSTLVELLNQKLGISVSLGTTGTMIEQNSDTLLNIVNALIQYTPNNGFTLEELLIAGSNDSEILLFSGDSDEVISITPEEVPTLEELT